MAVLHTAFGKLGNEKSRKGGDQCGGIENDGECHAVDASVGNERRGMRVSAFSQSRGNEDMLQRDQSRTHIGGKGDRERDADQLSPFTSACFWVVAGEAFSFIDPIQRCGEQTGCDFRERSAKNQCGAGRFDPAAHEQGEQIHGGKDFDRLFKHLYGGIFIDPSDGNEIAVERRGDRNEGKGDGKQTKRGDRTGVV